MNTSELVEVNLTVTQSLFSLARGWIRKCNKAHKTRFIANPNLPIHFQRPPCSLCCAQLLLGWITASINYNEDNRQAQSLDPNFHSSTDSGGCCCSRDERRSQNGSGSMRNVYFRTSLRIKKMAQIRKTFQDSYITLVTVTTVEIWRRLSTTQKWHSSDDHSLSMCWR